MGGTCRTNKAGDGQDHQGGSRNSALPFSESPGQTGLSESASNSGDSKKGAASYDVGEENVTVSLNDLSSHSSSDSGGSSGSGGSGGSGDLSAMMGSFGSGSSFGSTPMGGSNGVESSSHQLSKQIATG